VIVQDLPPPIYDGSDTTYDDEKVQDLESLYISQAFKRYLLENDCEVPHYLSRTTISSPKNISMNRPGTCKRDKRN